MARYRVGRTLGRTIYDDDTLIGMMDTPELGALLVDALNRFDPAAEPRPPTVYYFNDSELGRVILNDDEIMIGVMDSDALATLAAYALDAHERLRLAEGGHGG